MIEAAAAWVLDRYDFPYGYMFCFALTIAMSPFSRTWRCDWNGSINGSQ